MQETLHFLERYGYEVLFAFVLAEQMGLPIPAAPVLLAMGALAGAGHFSVASALAVGTAACLVSDLFWYELGRRRGRSVLIMLCRISLEPDSCVRQTELTFAKTGACSLLFAKFVPGLNTVAPPLAGIVGMNFARFLVCDAGGSIVWVATFLGLGYVLRNQLERTAQVALRMGSSLGVVLVAGLAVYIAWKWIERKRFLRRLRVARITPEELLAKIESGEEVWIVDLRHAIDGDGAKLPGAIHLPPQELETRHQEIPRDREVVLYCT